MQYINQVSANNRNARGMLSMLQHAQRGQWLKYKGRQGRYIGKDNTGFHHIVWKDQCWDAIDMAKQVSQATQDLISLVERNK